MSRRIEFYKVVKNDNLADPDYWNKRFEDIDLRLAAREDDADAINDAVNELESVGLARLNDTFTPLILEAQDALNTYGVNFSALSDTSIVVGTGTQVFDLTEETKDSYYYADWVAFRAIEDNDVTMLGTVTSYDRENGTLTVDIQYTNGSGTYDAWDIHIGSPPDETHASRTDNPHSVTAAQAGAYTIAQTITAINNAIAALPPISNALLKANNLSDLTSVPTARTNLGLGALAIESLVGIGLLSSALLATSSNLLAGTSDKLVKADVIASAMQPVALTDAATIAVNLATGVYFTVTIADNRVLGNPSNMKIGRTFYLKIKQDATGSRTLSYDTYYDFGQTAAPDLSTAASSEDLLAFFVVSATKIAYLGIRKGVE